MIEFQGDDNYLHYIYSVINNTNSLVGGRGPLLPEYDNGLSGGKHYPQDPPHEGLGSSQVEILSRDPVMTSTPTFGILRGPSGK